MEKIQIYNTLSRQKEVFSPLKKNQVTLYACGVTTYDHCHIGHALQMVIFDIWVRFFKGLGFEVTYVRNHTDVDDKIIARAAEKGTTPLALSQEMVRSAELSMQKLGCLQPTHSPKVSEHIPEIIQMIQDLEQKGIAYTTAQGNVYFRVKKFADYGKLSNRQPDDLLQEATGTDKEQPLDFALWKSESTEGAHWDSPWGKGRPGWHIECSAMSARYLGETFDIHGGGLDLIFPHHENEIAQSEACHGKQFARYWVHSGLLTIDQQKMSKSLGNHISVDDFLDKWPAEVLRLCFVAHHYRSQLNLSDKIFAEAFKRLYRLYVQIEKLTIPADQPLDREVMACLKDDLNTPKALPLIEQKLRGKDVSQAQAAAATAQQILGILGQDPKDFYQATQQIALDQAGISLADVEAKIQARKKAKSQKDYAAADKIRDELLAKNICLLDFKDDTTEFRLYCPDS